jgi:multidrug efflux pump subunit AcrA (membrane-fusion protein)
VAAIADNNKLDIVVDVPENVLGFIDKGDEIPITKNDRKYTGEFQALIPRGDISTRTFSVKIRLENPGGWIEGMEARALLPSKKPIQGLLVSRDAVVSKFGREVVFVVIDSRANMVPVEVLGYEGKKMGIRGKGLEPWMKAIVKGNERIRDGQPVQVKNASP